MIATSVFRPLASAGLLAAFASLASAQTVVVRNAPPGAPIELVLNADVAASGTADATGMATLTTDINARLLKSETGIHVNVDVCGQQRRVVLVEAGVPAPPQGSCSRGSVRDLFSLQRATTLVIDVTGETPVVWIRQGPAPLEWLGDRAVAEGTHQWAAPPVGLIVSGGVGGATFSNAVTDFCGDASTCLGKDLRPDVTAGVTYWLTRMLAVDVGFMRPSRVTATGSGTAFSFDSSLDARIVIVDGRVGAQVGPVRLYGLGGVNHLSAAATTMQTLTSSTVGAETFGFKADGWSWVAGGGVEMWPIHRVGVFFEGTVLSLKGDAIENGQGSIDDKLAYVTVGVRVAVGRK